MTTSSRTTPCNRRHWPTTLRFTAVPTTRVTDTCLPFVADWGVKDLYVINNVHFVSERVDGTGTSIVNARAAGWPTFENVDARNAGAPGINDCGTFHFTGTPEFDVRLLGGNHGGWTDDGAFCMDRPTRVRPFGRRHLFARSLICGVGSVARRAAESIPIAERLGDHACLCRTRCWVYRESKKNSVRCTLAQARVGEQVTGSPRAPHRRRSASARRCAIPSGHKPSTTSAEFICPPPCASSKGQVAHRHRRSADRRRAHRRHIVTHRPRYGVHTLTHSVAWMPARQHDFPCLPSYRGSKGGWR